MFFTILLILAMVAVALFVGYLLLVGVFYLVGFAVTAWQLHTGRITREQLAQNAEQYRKQKKQEKQRKRFARWLHDLFHPSATDIALGRSGQPTQVNININIDDKVEN